MKNVKHAKCVRCGRIYAAAPDLTSCACGGILDIVYDYDYIRSTFTKDDLAQRRDSTMWRFRELLPVEEQAITWAPASRALATAIALARSFREAVGLMPSSLM